MGEASAGVVLFKELGSEPLGEIEEAAKLGKKGRGILHHHFQIVRALERPPLRDEKSLEVTLGRLVQSKASTLLALVPSCRERTSAASKRSAANANQSAGLLSSVFPSFIQTHSSPGDFPVERAAFAELRSDAFRSLGENGEGKICKIRLAHRTADFEIAVQLRFDAAADDQQIHVAVLIRFTVRLATKEHDLRGPDAFDDSVQAGFELVRVLMHRTAWVTQSGKLRRPTLGDLYRQQGRPSQIRSQDCKVESGRPTSRRDSPEDLPAREEQDADEREDWQQDGQGVPHDVADK